MSDMTPKKPRAFRLDPTLDDALVICAKEQERTVSWVIERAVRNYLVTHAAAVEAPLSPVGAESAGPLATEVARILRARHAG